MQTTANYGLKKPDGTDVVNIQDFNDNAEVIDTALQNKIDKVAGKDLSTNDYTTSEKNKLAGVAAGANNYVHPSTHPPAIIAQDSNNRFVSDAEKSTWNGKAGTGVATTSANGLMSSTDKVKLDGVAAGANNYVHPSGDGNIHVPATGTSNNGKVLKAGAAAGSLSWGTLGKGDVGLGNVDNTSDANKPVSSAQQAILNMKTNQADFDAHLADFTQQIPYAVTAGSANAYTASTTPALPALVAGVAIAVKFHAANTGAATLNWNGKGAKAIKKANGSDVSSGNLKLNGVYTLRYDGTSFILQGEGGEYGTAGAGQVLQGYTFGTENGVATGEIPVIYETYANDILAVETLLRVTPTAGYYSGISQSLVADYSFIPANIIQGISIFGLVGTSTAVNPKPGENLILNATGGFANSTSPFPIAGSRITMKYAGRIRTKFDLSVQAEYGGTAYGQWYKNGNPVGTQRSTTSETYITYTEDIDCAANDQFQLYVWCTSGGRVLMTNFRVGLETIPTPQYTIP